MDGGLTEVSDRSGSLDELYGNWHRRFVYYFYPDKLFLNRIGNHG